VKAAVVEDGVNITVVPVFSKEPEEEDVHALVKSRPLKEVLREASRVTTLMGDCLVPVRQTPGQFAWSSYEKVPTAAAQKPAAEINIRRQITSFMVAVCLHPSALLEDLRALVLPYNTAPHPQRPHPHTHIHTHLNFYDFYR